MKYAFKVLLLTGTTSPSPPIWDRYNFLPGSRFKNYLELLTGHGIPHDCIAADKLSRDDLILQDVILYSAVIMATPINTISPDIKELLLHCSSQHGVVLVADSFLFRNRDPFLPAFGLRKCRGLRFGRQCITNGDGMVIYQSRCYPYSAQGRQNGLRPLLRMLMQSWLAKKAKFDNEAGHTAIFADGTPAVTSFPFGRATNYLLNFHPSFILAEGNPLHREIKKILQSNRLAPAVTFDLDNIIALRLDDPGSCERVHLEKYNPGVVAAEAWEKLADSIRQQDIHLNIAYVPLWVDDGAPAKGTLVHRGKTVNDRQPGRVYRSGEITYFRAGADHATHDYASEFKAIAKGVDTGVFSILAHGLTHLSTDVAAWLRAKDKYTNCNWYREFREMAGGRQPESTKLDKMLHRNKEILAEYFKREPRVLVPSAHKQTPAVVKSAARAGFQFFSSRASYLLRKNDVIVNRKLLAFYPDEMDGAYRLCQAGYPVIFVCHDYNLFHNGTDWLLDQVERFRQWGIRRFPPLDDLACLLLTGPEVIHDTDTIAVTIDLNQPGQPFTPGFDVPLKIAGRVARVSINGQSFCQNPVYEEGWTRLAIPARQINCGHLQISIDMSTTQ